MDKKTDKYGESKDEKMEREFQKWLERKTRKTKPTGFDIAIYRNCFYTAYMCGMKEVMETIKK